MKGTLRRGVAALAVGVLFSVTLAAQDAAQQALRKGEKPTPEFQAIMKANTAIVAVDGRAGTIAGTVAEALKKDDFDSIVKDTATLRGNFQKIEAFFASRKIESAVGFAKAGLQAIDALETAAKAKDRDGAFKAQVNLATACRSCHVQHRVHVLTIPLTFEIR